MPSISIIYRKDKVNKKGESPIHFRIIKDRKISYISSGIKLTEEFWDSSKNKIKGKHINSARLNSFITNKFAELQDQVYEHETVLKSTTTRKLKEKIYGKKPLDFFPFAEAKNKPFLQDGKIGTYDKNKAIIAKLKTYVGSSNFTFQDIDQEFLLKYDRYMKDTLKNKQSTANNTFKFISQLFKKAYNEDLIEHQINPFNKFKIKETKSERSYLSEEELALIDNYRPTPGTCMVVHRDMFVFAAYTAGIRVSDMLQLRWGLFDGTNMNITMKKTGGQISIKVPNKGLEILSKYRNGNPDGADLIFPVLSKDLNVKNAIDLDTAISGATAHINKNLKFISKKVGITKTVSFHVSRHTWATRALRKGMSIDKVSKLMGHANIKETLIYAKIVSEELDKAMDVFND